MPVYLVVAFAGVALTLIAVPGPDWAFVIAAGARDRMVLPVVAGLMIGYTLITATIAVGVGPLVATTPVALIVLTLGGAAYLIYLGIGFLRHPGGLQRISERKPSPLPRSGRVIAKGIGVSALNPKGLLIFLAILPQFTRSDQVWPITLQLAVLGAAFTLICGLFYLALGYAADRVLGSRPRLAQIITRIAGVAMIGVGLILGIERVIDAVKH
ncbi:LysE family translocator [Glaciihabitans sp. UYNi722]|uniref:LysE family translocator n=1 Tax=Glaciihabitans sp. UYNi722 TaxID=3156344 RepID=UPI00339A8CCD